MNSSLKTLLAVAALAASASVANAGIMHYPTLTAGGITVSNITETNDTTSDFYYGAGSLNGTVLSFPVTGSLPFKVTSSGAGDSDVIDVKLSFDVSSQSAMPIAAFLGEIGDYFASGTGTGGDSASILLFGPNDTLLAGGTASYNAPAGTTGAIWQNAVVASGAGTANSFHVVIDNVLHTATVASTDFALIEKKGVAINLGSTSGTNPPTPEPATLGVLGLGAVALISRRRKA